MSSHEDDKLWRIIRTTIVFAVLVGLFVWWVIGSREPDAPFSTWLATATRDDIKWNLIACVFCGVYFARVLSRDAARK